jgi:hypothetical protein
VLNREQALLRKMAAEKKKETDIKASLGEFAALVSTNLKRISFENKQKLLRMVLDKVVVSEWRVDVHYNIPLPRSAPTPEQKVSTKFDLRSTCTRLCLVPDYVVRCQSSLVLGFVAGFEFVGVTLGDSSIGGTEVISILRRGKK